MPESPLNQAVPGGHALLDPTIPIVTGVVSFAVLLTSRWSMRLQSGRYPTLAMFAIVALAWVIFLVTQPAYIGQH